jgi:replicative DNA helicase
MKRLLRSVIDVDGAITPEQLVHNFTRLRDAGIEWLRTDDLEVFRFVQAYFDSRLELPSIATARDYFERGHDIECLERLKDIVAADYYVRTNFAHLLESIRDEQAKVKLIALLKETQAITLRGVEFKEGGERVRKHGVKDALHHILKEASNVLPPDKTRKTDGDITREAKELWAEYQDAKLHRGKAYGKLTGLAGIDEVCHGVKRGELWIHAAFASELKTTFSINTACNLVTRYRTNIVYWSLEMTYEQVRRNFVAIHSASAKWEREKLGKALDYRKIRDGELSEEEEAFYQLVLQDWENNPEHYHCQIVCPDHKVTVSEIRHRSEILHKEFEVGLIVIDHGLLLRPEKEGRDYIVNMNSCMRDAKQMALQFNAGEGVPVLLLWQTSREGKKAADKADGRYALNALAWANEAERSADVVTTTYLDDQRRACGTTLVDCLKNRDNPLFAPFEARVMFGSRRIKNLDMDFGSGISVDDMTGGIDDV